MALTLPQLNAVHPPVETLDINPSESTSRNQNYMYTPKNIKCGIPAIGNKPKPMLMGMLKIIGGKTSRKGQWPWQVAILNRHKVKKKKKYTVNTVFCILHNILCVFVYSTYSTVQQKFKNVSFINIIT